MDCSGNTAILVFAQSAHAESKRKPLVGSHKLVEALNQDTLKKVRKTGLPYVHFTENQQQGHSFGERFTNAMLELFSQGYDHIIAIGNDSPQLSDYQLLWAFKQVQLGKTVVGPSLDGGFYLLGIQRQQFFANQFRFLPWQKSTLFDTLSEILVTSGCTLVTLKPLRDIDCLADMAILVKVRWGISRLLLNILGSLLALPFKIPQKEEDHKNLFYITRLFNKGSPIPTA